MLWEWLLTPIDPGRVHEVGFAVSWHGRAMVLGWGVLAPLAVLIARFFKVMPGQDWPRVLDNQVWWRCHWISQSVVLALSVLGLVLVLPSDPGTMSVHGWLGYAVLVGLAIQFWLGYARGTKGGPTAPSPAGDWRGDHYDMTPWRRRFELVHKSVGYTVLVLAVVVILLGLWKANAPHWMWLLLALWWPMLLIAAMVFQRRGMAIDTYQAIWGLDASHPGNAGPAPGWGVRRIKPPHQTKG